MFCLISGQLDALLLSHWLSSLSVQWTVSMVEFSAGHSNLTLALSAPSSLLEGWDSVRSSHLAGKVQPGCLQLPDPLV